MQRHHESNFVCDAAGEQTGSVSSLIEANARTTKPAPAIKSERPAPCKGSAFFGYFLFRQKKVTGSPAQRGCHTAFGFKHQNRPSLKAHNSQNKETKNPITPPHSPDEYHA